MRAITYDQYGDTSVLKLTDQPVPKVGPGEVLVRDAQRAVPQARLVEAEPDLVGVSDIADLFGFSRQNMRKLVQTHRESFPLPLHEGRSSLWHLADVLDWFETRQQRVVDPRLREMATASMAVNAAREAARIERANGEPDPGRRVAG